jgi:DNA repair protein RAD5
MSILESNEAFYEGASSEKEDVIMEDSTSESPIGRVDTELQPQSLLGKRLFFADSDDEDAGNVASSPLETSMLFIQDESGHSDSDISLAEQPRASSVSNASSAPISPRSSPAPAVKTANSWTKKPRLVFSNSPATTPFSSAYFGSFIIGNAWSTVKGKGYVKPGDEINVERDEPAQRLSSNVGSNVDAGKAKKTDGNSKKKTTQLSIATMLKAQPPKTAKKPVDSVVRLTNSRGFG